MAKRTTNQPQWNEIGLEDLRSLSHEHRLHSPEAIEEAESYEGAINILMREFGLQHESDVRQLKTPIGFIDIEARHLGHIVEKRRDARERYIHYALTTIKDPFEIWRSQYDNDTVKFQFIGTYTSQYQMLVVVAQHDTHTLWNFMQIDAKRLNKHRSGEVIYQRKG
ncbi:PBECR2 nuclease fold domain-containing protein [Marinomonas arenicola]|uniref:PBECR2 nuclease fold domain-containing protein n=1 Tax=Marinomonas arenicola TaxID=569601 RepID=UPI00311EE0AB